MTAPHNDTELDELEKYLNGIVRVKLDDKQKGYMLAKLSPKDKSKIKAILTQYIHKQVTEARQSEIEWVIGVAFKDDSLQILLQDRLAHLRKGEL
jgi:hypothetical protein